MAMGFSNDDEEIYESRQRFKERYPAESHRRDIRRDLYDIYNDLNKFGNSMYGPQLREFDGILSRLRDKIDSL